MGWIRKYWYLILALGLVIAYIFVPFAEIYLLITWLLIRTYILTFPPVFFIFSAIIIFLVFRAARARDYTQNKTWIMQHIRQLVIVPIVVLGAGYWGAKIMEKSKNELFNQLIDIMESNVPKSDTSYNLDITNLVCPLVNEEKLNEMMEDKFAKGRMKYFDYPYTISGREGDVRWEIALKSWKKNGVPSLSTLELIIIINKTDDECDARIRHYPFGA